MTQLFYVYIILASWRLFNSFTAAVLRIVGFWLLTKKKKITFANECQESETKE